MDIMEAVSKRATCDRGRSASVIVKEKRILTTGYVGSPIGVEHCDDVGHELHEVLNPDGSESKHCVRTTHSEQNAIAQAARYGIAIDGATIYTKMEPCYTCAKIIINAGIKEVVCKYRYHQAQRSREVFKKAGVKLRVLEDSEITYEDME